jgi:glycerol uptake facilitator protein
LAVGFTNTGFGNHVWWVPVAGPLLGGLIGALIYDSIIRPFLPTAAAENHK